MIFFHVDQFLVQLMFNFNAYHPAGTCYNQASSKLNNAETVGIVFFFSKKKHCCCRFRRDLIHYLGELELPTEYEFEKQ